MKGKAYGLKQDFRSALSSQAVRGPVVIGLGAIAGALSRTYLTSWISQWLGTAFPFGTLLVNLSGAFAMGVFATLALERSIISPEIRLMIAVGFLGSFTTFSSYELESEQLLVTQSLTVTSLYWLGSAILGVICLKLGTYLARRLP